MQNAIVSSVAAAAKLYKSDTWSRNGSGNGNHAYVINCKGFDLDDPTLPRRSSGPDQGKIMRPAERGYGCPACMDKDDKYHPQHNRDPRQCRWFDESPIYWECLACKKSLQRNPKGTVQHSLIPGKCKFAVPRLLPPDHGQPRDEPQPAPMPATAASPTPAGPPQPRAPAP